MLLLSLGQTLGKLWVQVNNVTGGVAGFAVAHPYITWFLLGIVGWKLLPAKALKKVSWNEKLILMIVLSVILGPLILVASLFIRTADKFIGHVWSD